MFRGSPGRRGLWRMRSFVLSTFLRGPAAGTLASEGWGLRRLVGLEEPALLRGWSSEAWEEWKRAVVSRYLLEELLWFSKHGCSAKSEPVFGRLDWAGLRRSQSEPQELKPLAAAADPVLVSAPPAGLEVVPVSSKQVLGVSGPWPASLSQQSSGRIAALSARSPAAACSSLQWSAPVC